jgi:membrane-associated protease RseP (regulator of RpoE activity)
VSSHLPDVPFDPSPRNRDPLQQNLHFDEPGPSKKEWIVSATLLLLTLVSTSFAGIFYLSGVDFLTAFQAFIHRPGLIMLGLPFSVPLISILLAHELGHFIACRHYGMRCTPPYFLPVPISLAGTFGAFIKIKSQFRHKRALFDIGIAGPLAGFVFVIPTLWIGIGLSKVVPKGAIHPGQFSFGEPLIFRFLGHIILGYSPEKQDMLAHPMAMAAWVGLLATSLNLLPIWQLDGGHISYAVLGRSLQKKVSMIVLGFLVLVSFAEWPPSYTLLFFAALLLIIGARLRFFHPPTFMEEERLGRGRLLLGLLAFLILLVSFTPVPVTIT